MFKAAKTKVLAKVLVFKSLEDEDEDLKSEDEDEDLQLVLEDFDSPRGHSPGNYCNCNNTVNCSM